MTYDISLTPQMIEAIQIALRANPDNVIDDPIMPLTNFDLANLLDDLNPDALNGLAL